MSNAGLLFHRKAAPQRVEAPKIDPFVYGWRDVEEMLATGERQWTRIPLTLDDVLHPQEDDILMPTSEHERIRNYLINVMMALVADDPTAVVLSDTNVAWDDPEIRPHRPDMAVIFGVRNQRVWSTFDVREEGVRPALIIEITSPKTRHLDLEDKFNQYERLGVQVYVIIDIAYRARGVVRQLRGFDLTPDGYASLLLNEHGWLWLEPVGAWLAIIGDEIRCLYQNGEPLEDYVTLSRSKQRAERRAAEANRRIIEANRRAAEEAQARAEANRRAAEEAQARAEANRRAVEEAQARAEAEAVIVELKARLLQIEQARPESPITPVGDSTEVSN